MNGLTPVGKAGIPIFGLGTWRLSGRQCVDTITAALEIGYRHFDTAAMYGNHVEIGQAINSCPIAREQLFITSKVWPTDLGSAATLQSLGAALKELNTDYLDLYLIHWPGNDRRKRLQSYETMLREREKGTIRHLGVANFSISQIQEIKGEFGELPTVNQIYATPFNYDREDFRFLQEQQITITAYSPLDKGHLLDHPTLARLADKYGKKPAQIALRWFIDHGVVTIPKTSNPERLRSNFEIFDFKLEPEDLDF